MKDELSFEQISKLIRYDRETGQLTWLERQPAMFKDSRWGREQSCAAWNARYANKPALTTKHSAGYLHGTIDGKQYFAHRVAWLLETGEWPADQIDHENGNRADNRFVNLRDVSTSVNRRNTAQYKRNTSGVTGVCFDKRRGKWMAYISTEVGQNKFIGYFPSIEAATEARLSRNAEFGYSARHGS
ncbi:HNH endonuclease [Rhizobium sp. 2MFCol3.1]|uniref:HNH endonuclease n=1 Tax=Rhizobium sp. 2MFCol3.1 TaxID=1246459 RepID=UPI00035E5C3B|nr:HNH endonuclease [Rhizobium sp. 2MFCol3.1]